MKKTLCLFLAALLLSIPCISANAAVFEPSESYKNGSYYDALCEVSLSGDMRQDIANVALSQVGYHEGKSEGDLSGASTGKNNYTQYGADYGIPSDSWCAAFVWWCARNAGVGASVIPKTEWAKTLCYGCPYSALSESKNIRIGDLVFLDNSLNDSIEDHVGIIVAVTDDKITTVEGNYSNSVQKRTYSRYDGKSADGKGKILYIGFPDYESGNNEVDYETPFALLHGDTKCYSSVKGKESGKTLSEGEYLLIAKVSEGGSEWYQVASGLDSFFIKGSGVDIVTVSVPPVSGCDPYTTTDVSFTQTAEPTDDTEGGEVSVTDVSKTTTTSQTTRKTQQVTSAQNVTEGTKAPDENKKPDYESFVEDEGLKYVLYAIFGVLFISLAAVIISAAKRHDGDGRY